MNVPRASRTALYSCILLALSACVAPGTGPDLAERTYAELADLPPPPLSIPDYVSEALANNSSLPGLSAADAERFNVSVQAMPAQAVAHLGDGAEGGRERPWPPVRWRDRWTHAAKGRGIRKSARMDVRR